MTLDRVRAVVKGWPTLTATPRVPGGPDQTAAEALVVPHPVRLDMEASRPGRHEQIDDAADARAHPVRVSLDRVGDVAGDTPCRCPRPPVLLHDPGGLGSRIKIAGASWSRRADDLHSDRGKEDARTQDEDKTREPPRRKS